MFPAGKHDIRIVLTAGKPTMVFLDGELVADRPKVPNKGVNILDDFTKPVSGKVNVTVSTLSNATIRLWDFKYRGPGAGRVSLGDQVQLIQANDLASSAWKHDYDNPDHYADTFSIENGVLIKKAREKQSKVSRSTNFTRGEFVFDYDMEGDYWQFNIYGKGSSIGLTFHVSARGKHECRIGVSETEIMVFLDGKPIPEGDSAIKYKAKLKAPLKAPNTLRIYISDATGIRLSNMRYRQAK